MDASARLSAPDLFCKRIAFSPSFRSSFRPSLIGLSQQQAQFRGSVASASASSSEVPKLISLGWSSLPSQISSSPIQRERRRGHIVVDGAAVLVPLVPFTYDVLKGFWF